MHKDVVCSPVPAQYISYPTKPSFPDSQGQVVARRVGSHFISDTPTRDPREHLAVCSIQHSEHFVCQCPGFTPIGEQRADCCGVEPDFDSRSQVWRVEKVSQLTTPLHCHHHPGPDIVDLSAVCREQGAKALEHVDIVYWISLTTHLRSVLLLCLPLLFLHFFICESA